MPGIAGIISENGTEREPLVKRMIRAMNYEPFYTSGTYSNANLGLSAGWVCQEGAFADPMPVWNDKRDIGLIFTGEDFRPSSEIQSLRGNGHDFESGRADYLPHLYEQNPKHFLPALNGWFSGVLVDLREGKTILFNDRFGLSRLYIHETKEALYFASEAKALLAVVPELRRFDIQSLAEHFSCGAALQNRSIFKGVAVLPGASAWTFRPGQRWAKQTYFDKRSWQQQEVLAPDEYYPRLKEIFVRVLPQYFQGQQKVALSLTGGQDSRMILAGMDFEPRRLPCYTFGGMYRECADVRIAKQLAAVLEQDHETISVTRSFFGDFRSLAERSVFCSDGAMDVTGAVELFANRRARQIAPVRMTGNYGSEILRGNVVFKVGRLNSGMFATDFNQEVARAAQTFGRERGQSRTAFIVEKQVPWYHYARLALERSQLTVRSPFLDNELVALAYRAPAQLAVNKEHSHRLIAECCPKIGTIPTDRGVSGGAAYASKFKVFCQEFLPRAEYVYDYGMPPWMTKVDGVLRPLHIERLFLGWQKFYHFRTWYRDELSNYVREILLDPRTLSRPYLNRKEVERMVSAHTSGFGNFTLEIHKLLTSELIERLLVEPRVADAATIAKETPALATALA
ncbi:MAG TPA: asparagine synthase-related protein [Candidatus Dormibacteraeota bacterium]|nr:asparagine synthase-related protein [Candidatus Dormibacteraeota bacterium]